MTGAIWLAEPEIFIILSREHLASHLQLPAVLNPQSCLNPYVTTDRHHLRETWIHLLLWPRVLGSSRPALPLHWDVRWGIHQKPLYRQFFPRIPHLSPSNILVTATLNTFMPTFSNE